ncbi:hypothetical protein PM082_007451 [Marasmius tenuissimus]|nr:hypothetical protein PM082_007451 [Marasmius tenuissimus]
MPPCDQPDVSTILPDRQSHIRQPPKHHTQATSTSDSDTDVQEVAPPPPKKAKKSKNSNKGGSDRLTQDSEAA